MGYKNKKNNTLGSAQHSDTSRNHCHSAHSPAGGLGRRRGKIGGKTLPTLAIFSLLTLGVAHPFNADGLRAQEEAANEQPALPRAAVIPDEEQGVIRFIIEGREVMRLDAAGLHVREELSTGDTWTVYGHIGFDSHLAESSDVE